MEALVEICQSASASTTYLQELQSNYEPLIKRVAELAALDAMAEANQRFVYWKANFTWLGLPKKFIH